VRPALAPKPAGPDAGDIARRIILNRCGFGFRSFCFGRRQDRRRLATLTAMAGAVAAAGVVAGGVIADGVIVGDVLAGGVLAGGAITAAVFVSANLRIGILGSGSFASGALVSGTGVFLASAIFGSGAGAGADGFPLSVVMPRRGAAVSGVVPVASQGRRAAERSVAAVTSGQRVRRVSARRRA